MKPYAKVYRSGAFVTMCKDLPSGMYTVKLYSANGELSDKVRCDDYRNALDYRKSFNAIAKNAH